MRFSCTLAALLVAAAAASGMVDAAPLPRISSSQTGASERPIYMEGGLPTTDYARQKRSRSSAPRKNRRDLNGDDQCSKFEITGWHTGNYATTLWPSSAPDGSAWTWRQCAAECAKATACDFWTLQLTSNRQCLLMTDFVSKALREYTNVEGAAFEGDRQQSCGDEEEEEEGELPPESSLHSSVGERLVSVGLCPDYKPDCGNKLMQTGAMAGDTCAVACQVFGGARWCPTTSDHSGNAGTPWGWCPLTQPDGSATAAKVAALEETISELQSNMATDLAALKNSMATSRDLADLKSSMATSRDLADLKSSMATATDLADLKSSTSTDLADLKSSTATSTDLADLKSSTSTNLTELQSNMTAQARVAAAQAAQAAEMVQQASALERAVSGLIQGVAGLQAKVVTLERALAETVAPTSQPSSPPSSSADDDDDKYKYSDDELADMTQTLVEIWDRERILETCCAVGVATTASAVTAATSTSVTANAEVSLAIESGDVAVGDSITFSPGEVIEETATITSVGAGESDSKRDRRSGEEIAFTPALKSDHPAGATVVIMAADATTKHSLCKEMACVNGIRGKDGQKSNNKRSDSKSWHKKGKPAKNCNWVASAPTKAKHIKRCLVTNLRGKRAVDECKAACAPPE